MDSLVHTRSPRLKGLLLPDSGGAQVIMEAARTPDIAYMTDTVQRETKNSLRRTEQGSECLVSISIAASVLLIDG